MADSSNFKYEAIGVDTQLAYIEPRLVDLEKQHLDLSLLIMVPGASSVDAVTPATVLNQGGGTTATPEERLENIEKEITDLRALRDSLKS